MFDFWIQIKFPTSGFARVRELEQKAGRVFACITPERHKKGWRQKASKLEQEIAAATAKDKERLQQKLLELNHREQKQAYRIAEVHSLLAQGS
jgi:hypothetical protein